MNPAPSVIVFTVLSGLGFGYLACLGLGLIVATGGTAFWLWGLGYGLVMGGLTASTFHLGNRQRALLAFTQWRSSWLSREAWGAVLTLLTLAPMALSDWLGLGLPRIIGAVGAVLALVTVGITAMIYAQLKTVPRWNHWTTPVTYLLFALAGGTLLAGLRPLAVPLLGALGGLMVLTWHWGDRRFADRGHSLGTATGLGDIGQPSVFEQPHTGENYLMREMIYVVGRKHAARLRGIALVFGCVLPAFALLLLPGLPAIVLASLMHLTGACAARWLFFAEAEHVVGLYYGKR